MARPQSPFTVEVQNQYDPTESQWDHQIFIKLYTAALASGFLSAISDRDWKTLCVIALHMDAEGQCYPSLMTIAGALGVNKSTASDRVRSLLRFRWNDKPLIRATRLRRADGTLAGQIYTILPLTPLRFGSKGRGRPLPTNQLSSSGNGELDASNTSSDKGELVTSSGLSKLVSSTLDGPERNNKIPNQQEPQNDGTDPSDLASAGERSGELNQATEGARYLKEALRTRGMRTFPRDWHLKARSKAATLLRAGLSSRELRDLIDWCLTHPFWHDKITSMDKVADLVGQWQQQQGRRGDDTPIPTTGHAGRHPDRGTLDALVVRRDTRTL